MTRIAGTGSTNRIFQGQRKDFIVMRKDTFEYIGTYTYTDEDNTTLEYDFTDCIGAMAIKKKKTDTTAVRIVSVSFDEEEYTLYVDAEDMDMDAGKYYYDLQIYDADSKMVTKMYGDFIVLQDITDMHAPEEEEIYLSLQSIIGIEKMMTLKNNLLLTNSLTYQNSTVNRISLPFINTEIVYNLQPSVKNTAIISNTIMYQLMTFWFKTTNIMSSTVGYLATLVYTHTGGIGSEISWIDLSEET